MTFAPSLSPFAMTLLVIALLAGVALIWLPTRVLRDQVGDRRSVATRVRRTVLIAALFLAILQPGVAQGRAVAATSDLNVFFVVDTTGSMVANDWNGTQPRLDGVRSDVLAMSEAYPGARFSLITFDSSAVVRMPLTSDTTALSAAVETLTPETTDWSTGSSITVAGPVVAQTVARAVQAHPERANVVVYMGDGEQTASTPPEPFALPRDAINGGVVLGYGTSAGGRMNRTVNGAVQKNIYVKDPSTGTDAISRIDEPKLQGIADSIGVAYVHRSAGDPITAVTSTIRVKEVTRVVLDPNDETAGRAEYFWIPLILAGLLIAWEIGAALLTARKLRVAGGSLRSPAPRSPSAPASIGPDGVDTGGEAPTARTEEVLR